MHFTYEPKARTDLSQGDLIHRTPQVDELLRNVHPHYFKSSSYRFFIVLTQSCDLVRRNGEPCKARYISIAAVRPLQLVIERELNRYQRTDLEKNLKFCSQDIRPKLFQFMERILNNNEEEFFFLFREPDIGLIENHCAFLHLSIAVKAELHYQTLLSARVLQLKESFQHKLGHLVGNLYSRVGTEDWLPDNCKPEDFERLCHEPVNNEETVLWLEKSIHKAVIAKLRQIQSPSLEDFKKAVKETKATQENRKQQVLAAVKDVLTDCKIENQLLEKIVRRIENQPLFQTAFK